MSAQHHVAFRERQGRFCVITVAVGQIKPPTVNEEDGIFGQHGKGQHHLIDLALAVSAHRNQLLRTLVQKSNHFLRCVALRKIVARAVIEQIAEKHAKVRLLLVKAAEQLPRTFRVAVNIRRDQKLGFRHSKHPHYKKFCSVKKRGQTTRAPVFDLNRFFALPNADD